MNWINKIGQRKTSKLLCGVSFLSSFVLQVLAYGAVTVSSLALWVSCLIIAIPIALLSACVHFTRKYRLYCIYAQIAFVVINFLVLLLAKQNYLLPIYVGEIIVFAILALVFYAMPTSSSTVKKKNSRGNRQVVEKPEDIPSDDGDDE